MPQVIIILQYCTHHIETTLCIRRLINQIMEFTQGGDIVADRPVSDFFKKDMHHIETYQASQMNLLKSMEQSLKSTIDVNKQVENNLRSIQDALDSLSSESTSPKKSTSNADSVTKLVSDTIRRQRTADVQQSREMADILSRFNEDTSGASESYQEAASKQKAAIDYFMRKSIELFESLGRIANDWSTSGNAMMKLTGVHADTMRDQRSDFTDLIAGMNKNTDYAFNALSSYKNIIGYFQGVTGDIHAIQEMAGPLLKAQETMPVDISHLATLFNKFTIRYNLSSQSMEEVLNNILGNTADSPANAEKSLEAIDSLKPLIYWNSSNEQEATEAMNSVSNAVSLLQNMDVDTSKFLQLAHNFGTGNFGADTFMSMMASYGKAGDQYQLYELIKNNDYQSFVDAYIETLRHIGDEILNIKDKERQIVTMKSYADQLGYDVDTFMMDLTGASGKNYAELFAPSSEDTPTMDDLLQEQYRSPSTKLENRLSTLGDGIAKWQEEWHTSITDLTTIVKGIAAVVGAKTAWQGLGSILNKGSQGLSGGLKGLFRGSASSSAVLQATGNSLDDVARALSMSADDVIRTFGQQATYSLDDIAKGLSMTTDEVLESVGKSVINSSDDVLKGFGTGASKILGKAAGGIALAIEAVTTTINAKKAYDAGDYRGTASEIGGGIGSVAGIAGGKAGAAIGTAIAPGIGTVIGGVLGGLVGSIGGRKLGKLVGGGLYDVASSADIDSYDVGSNYITHTGLAMVHEGEEITPKQYNFASSGSGILTQILDDLDDSARYQSENIQQSNRELIQEIKELKIFLESWKSSSDKRDFTNNLRSLHATSSAGIQTYGRSWV